MRLGGCGKLKGRCVLIARTSNDTELAGRLLQLPGLTTEAYTLSTPSITTLLRAAGGGGGVGCLNGAGFGVSPCTPENLASSLARREALYFCFEASDLF